MIFYCFNTRVTTQNYQPFLTFVILPPHFYSYLLFLIFSYILLYFNIWMLIFYTIQWSLSSIYFLTVITSRYYYWESYNRQFNAIFYSKFAQLLLGGIIVENLKNPLWEMFSCLDIRVATSNKQPFLPFLKLPPYFFFIIFINYPFFLIMPV